VFNKRKTVFLVLFVFITLILNADPAGDIAKAGDDAWNSLVAQYRSESRLIDPVSANAVVNSFTRYEKKAMLFPSVDFTDFFIDPEGNKYYWYGDKNNLNIFIIKYDQSIQDKINALNNAFGNMGGKFEALGMIVDAWDLWGDVVYVEMLAMRVKNRACILIKNDAPVLAGQDIFDSYVKQQK